eukprot:54762_1
MSYRGGDHRRNRGGYRGGGYRDGGGGYRKGGYKRGRDEIEHQPTPQEIQESKTKRIRMLLVRIGERSASSLRKNLDMLSKALMKDLEENKDFILNTLFKCVENLPHKSAIYGMLVGLLNLRDYDFGGLVVARLQATLNQVFQRGFDANRIRILVRFAAELLNANVIMTSNLITLLDQIMDAVQQKSAMEDEEEGAVSALHPALTDYLVYVVMSVLPFAGRTLHRNADNELASLISRVGTYMQQRTSPAWSEILQSRRNVAGDAQPSTSDHLSLYWAALQPKATAEWKCASVLDPYVDFESTLARADQHSLAIDDIPALTGKTAPVPPSLFKIFDSSVVDECAKDPIDQLIIFEHLCDILKFFEADHKEATNQLLELPGGLSPRILVIEAIFSNLFHLPQTPCNIVFYGCVIVDMVKSQPKVIPKILGQAVCTIFERMDELEIQCRDRFSEWFAFHLSNFGFKWIWPDWSFVTSLEPASPRRAFCERTIRLCGDLASKRVKLDEILGEAMGVLGGSLEPRFKFAACLELEKKKKIASSSDVDGDEKMKGEEEEPKKSSEEFVDKDGNVPSDPLLVSAKKLLLLLERHAECEDILNFLEDQKTGGNLTDSTCLELFLQCLLYTGAKTFSRLFILMQRYKPVLVELTRDGHQDILVRTIHDVWDESSQNLHIILQKFVNLKYISPRALLKYVLSAERLAWVYRPYWTTIISDTLNRYRQSSVAVDELRTKVRIQLEEMDGASEEGDSKRAELAKRVEDIDARISKISDDQCDLLALIIKELSSAIASMVARGEEGLPLGVLKQRLVQFLRQFNKEIKKSQNVIGERIFEQVQAHPQVQEWFQSALEL